MYYSLPQYTFDYFYQPDYEITWASTESDSCYGIKNECQADQDIQLNISGNDQSNYDCRYNIYKIEYIESDTDYLIQSVSLCDVEFIVAATCQTVYDSLFIIFEAGKTMKSCILYTIREEEEFRN